MRSKKALKNVIFSLIQKSITIVCGFIIPKLIISNYGSNVNGLISSITQFLGYISLLESGFGPVICSMLYKPIAKNDKKKIENILLASETFFKKIALIFLAYIVILIIIYPTIINTEFSYIFTVSLILIISCSIFAEYFFGITYSLLIKSKQENYVVSIIQMTSTFVNVLLVTIFIKLGSSIQVVKLFSTLIFILKPIIQRIYVLKRYKINPSSGDKNYIIKNKWDGLAQHVASVIHNNTDVTVLTIFTNLTYVSIYSVYNLVLTGINNLIVSLTGGIEAGFGDMIAKNEHNNLNNRFNLYEIMYFSIITIIFTCTLLLITPFVSVYTRGITDANYIRYTFGYLIVLSGYICMIRLPYISITYAAGHFKETRVGAWLECFINIVVSLILVNRFGLIGVAIGTIIAMTIRAIEFLYHSNKYILKRSMWQSLKKILIIVIETIIIIGMCRYLPFYDNLNYIDWIKNAIMVFIIATIIVLISNIIIYRRETKEIKTIFMKLFFRKRV